MDANKLKKLKEIGYRIPANCGLCRFSDFAGIGELFGSCMLHRYQHLKHDNPSEGRYLSVCAFGTCDSFQEDSTFTAYLGGFADFKRP